MNKRFNLVLDEDCLAILDPQQQRPEFVRQAIKHYAECQKLSTQIDRLEKVARHFEAIQIMQPEQIIDATPDIKEIEEDPMDYVLAGVLATLDME
ncbi:MAG: hypothetical protein ACYCX4_01495 [Bacillota bacterium]